MFSLRTGSRLPEVPEVEADDVKGEDEVGGDVRDDGAGERAADGRESVDDAAERGDDEAVVLAGEQRDRPAEGAEVETVGRDMGPARPFHLYPAVEESAEEQLFDGRDHEGAADELDDRQRPAADGRIVGRGLRRLGNASNRRDAPGPIPFAMLGRDPEGEDDESGADAPERVAR